MEAERHGNLTFCLVWTWSYTNMTQYFEYVSLWQGPQNGVNDSLWSERKHWEVQTHQHMLPTDLIE